MVSRIAIIPARGGSKRIPHKNIIDFCGKPMIAWTIEAAKESKVFDRVLVSTDDVDIAEVARKYGAEVPFLREEHADDYSTVSEATISALMQAKEYWKESYEIVVQLMPNCPNRDTKDIQESVMAFDENDRNFQVSCFKFGWMNPWWAARIDEKGRPEKLFPKASKSRSQDLPELYCPTGAIWIAKTQALIKTCSFYGEGHRFEPISWISAVDIDDYSDLDFARVASQLKSKLSESNI